ncbi:MAG: CBS domain-containing protein [Candidatus Methylomirabilis sp.]|nr:CBS domain-containing protein [Deltaproteobacteria bacterium]
MEVITSHVNADFDAFASMVAAKRLYPDALLAFPGSVEKPLRDALKTLPLPTEVSRIKDIDIGGIRRLILVDVSSPLRIGPFVQAAERPGTDVHIYDHHPASPGDLSGSVEVRRPFGSNTTLLAHVLRERGIAPTPEEATIMMAGIYEDTGFLSYPSTTKEDYEAASFLLSSGADLKTVSDLLRKELTPEEVSLLNEFLQSQARYSVGGVEVVVAEAYLEKYKGDIAVLAHKLRDIENMECLFLLVDSEDRVHVIARSRNPRADAGRILKALGGGGHPNAASATLKGATLVQAREMLLEAIRANIVPARTAGDIMSFPPITLSPRTALKDAMEVMRRYGINAAPVVRNGTVQGVITRQVVDKAVYHGLGAAPVKDYMTTEVDWVGHDASIESIREKVVGHGQRLLPVLKDKKVVGVITRTDLIKLLQEELRAARDETKKVRVVSGLMKERLPAWAMDLLKEAGEVAEARGFKAYVVGGFVRDLIMRRENLDIDIVIEGGNGIVFAEDLARRRGASVRPHHRFKTAVLVFRDGYKLDVATARLEYYERPGALPTVEQSSLKLDLYRRDFIMNTLSVALNPGRFGELIDFFGAQKDLKERTIRVLHNLSFVEDPTRMLRAVRFAEKFDFSIGKHTQNLIKNSVKLDGFRTVSGPRIAEELKSILEEETSGKALKRLSDLGLLKLIHPSIAWDRESERLFRRGKEALAWYELLYEKDRVESWLVLFLALTDRLKDGELSALVARLGISGKKRLDVLGRREEARKALGKIQAGAARKGSDIYELLSPLPLELVLYLMAKAGKEPARKALSVHITTLRHIRPELRGGDLKRLGVAEGPLMGDILRALLKKRIDGETATREDEERIVKSFIKKGHGRAGRRA